MEQRLQRRVHRSNGSGEHHQVYNIAEVKALGIDEDSPLFHTMVKLMSRLDELEKNNSANPF